MRAYSRHSHKAKRSGPRDDGGTESGNNSVASNSSSTGSSNFVVGVATKFGFGRNAKHNKNRVNSNGVTLRGNEMDALTNSRNNAAQGAFPSFDKHAYSLSMPTPTPNHNYSSVPHQHLGKSFEQDSLPSLAASSDCDDHTVEKEFGTIDCDAKNYVGEKHDVGATAVTPEASHYSNNANTKIEKTVESSTPSQKQGKCSWAGIGFNDEISLCVSIDSTIGCSPINMADGVSVSSGRKLNSSSARPDTICFGRFGSSKTSLETELLNIDRGGSSLDDAKQINSTIENVTKEIEKVSLELISISDCVDDRSASSPKENCIILATRLEHMKRQLIFCMVRHFKFKFLRRQQRNVFKLICLRRQHFQYVSFGQHVLFHLLHVSLHCILSDTHFVPIPNLPCRKNSTLARSLSAGKC